MTVTGVLYFDLGSPYAYLAVERAESVLGYRPELAPILLGAIFRQRGWGSWAETDQRLARMAEIAARARRYGLPPIAWPPTWPADGLRAMRAATVAQEAGLVVPFATSVFRRQFVDGDTLSDAVIARACTEAGIEAEAVLAAIETPRVKQALATATDRAWEAGVRGVPSLRVAGELFYGDDSLETAAGRAGQDA
jgi:2-hydroxychromene-2-carboxylate isomerase